MDGRGRCMDNIFIERLWRSLKYEAVYLHELTDGFRAERVVGEWIEFYNAERPHSALAGRTPAEAYGCDWPVDMMDKLDGLTARRDKVTLCAGHFAVRNIWAADLKLDPNNIPERHANIVAWPSEKEERKIHAQELASNAEFELYPQPVD